MDYYKVERHSDCGTHIVFSIYRYKNIDDLEDELPPTQIISMHVDEHCIKCTSKYAKPIIVSDDDQQVIFDVIREYFSKLGQYPRQVIEYQNVLLKFNLFLGKNKVI
jgi:hypothetical protein